MRLPAAPEALTLNEARELLTKPVDPDRAWVALLSLEDAAEFALHADAAQHDFSDRDGARLAHQFGDELLPWLLRCAKSQDPRWPWLQCLKSLRTERTFDAIWSLVLEAQQSDQTTALDVACLEWVWAWPQTGFALLAERAGAGEPRAAVMLKSLADCHPVVAFRYVSSALGDARAREVFALAHASTVLNPWGMLTILDQGAHKSEAWPWCAYPDSSQVALAIRLVAASNENCWGVVFDTVEGSGELDCVVRRFVHGSTCLSGAFSAAVTLDFSERSNPDSTMVTGPSGPLTLPGGSKSSERPRRAEADRANADERHMANLRAYLRVHPAAFWSPIEDAVLAMDLGDSADVIINVDLFEHVPGVHAVGSHRAPIFPVDSRMYRSLIRSLWRRDSALFDPGEPNTRWNAI